MFCPYFSSLGENGTQFTDICLGELIIVQIGGEHGANIPVIKAPQERVALLGDILIFCYEGSVDKHAPLFFVGQGALRHETPL